MTYKQATEYIDSLLAFGIKPGLERIRFLLEKTGNPQDELTIIHVAGTNGKGSTCAMIASILKEGGYKTGLFISPYVTEFRERIQINGGYIPESALIECVERLKPIAERMAAEHEAPTEFEFITALALTFFKECGTDVVVLETGLGGRFDSTNVSPNPLVSVITAISMDHMAVLGDTLEKIAYEKCGIIKKGRPVVSTPLQYPEVISVIEKTAESLNAPLHIPDISAVEVYSADVLGSLFSYGGSAFGIPLSGGHQINNAITAIEAVRSCGLNISESQIKAGLGKTSFPARMEVLSESPLVILDGAHNPDGAKALMAVMEPYHGRITAIVGMMKDKDYSGNLSVIGEHCKSIITLEIAGNKRSLTAGQLKDAAAFYCVDVIRANSDEEALRLAKEKSGGEPILICGSFYLAGQIRQKALRFFSAHH